MRIREGETLQGVEIDPSILEPSCRRAYYRVAGFLPIRFTPLSIDDIDTAVFDLSLPDPLAYSVDENDENPAMSEHLRRIEGKLDLLLGLAKIDAPRQLSGQDRQSVVFSGAGLSLDVTWFFSQGDAYGIEILLPSPYSRAVRAVGFAVHDSPLHVGADAMRLLALELKHMEPDDRDALVAYSYDLQRVALRARGGEGRDS